MYNRIRTLCEDKDLSQRALAGQYTMEDILLNRPNFDEDKIHEYHLSFNEAQSIDILANIYGMKGEIEKSLAMREKLIINLERTYRAIDHTTRVMYMNQIYNQCYGLYEAKKYEACQEMADKGLSFALGDVYAVSVYMVVMRMKAKALLRLNQKQEGDALMKRYLLYTYSMEENQDSTATFDIVKTEFQDEFGYQLDLTLPW